LRPKTNIGAKAQDRTISSRIILPAEHCQQIGQLSINADVARNAAEAPYT
jgi:hypothetical protein